MIHFAGVLQVQIEDRRWDVKIRVLDAHGTEMGAYIVSADAALTMGDGIWLGTVEEYRKAVEAL